MTDETKPVMLTKPQRNLLIDLNEGPQHVSDSYAPASALLLYGFAEWVRGRYSDSLRITDAGRATIAKVTDAGRATIAKSTK